MRDEASTRWIEAGGHRLRCVVSGDGALTLLCLHGLVDRLEIWDRLSGPLAEFGRVARIDQRGHGESEAPPGPYRREDLAADVALVIEALGAPRAVLVGHSMGGIVAMTAALSHPERIAGLVLIGTASQCSEKVAGWYERIARAGEREGTDGIARAIYGDASEKRVDGDAQGISHVTRMLKSLHSDPLTAKLSAIRCPVLLIVGENDPMGPKASPLIAAQIPHAELVVVPGCGHWVHVDEPGAVIEAFARFAPRIDGSVR